MLKKLGAQQTELEIVTIDSLVSTDHRLRKIKAVVASAFIHDRLAGLCCPDTGRPQLGPTFQAGVGPWTPPESPTHISALAVVRLQATTPWPPRVLRCRAMR